MLGEKKKNELLEKHYLIVQLYQQHQVSTLTAKGKVLTCILVLREDVQYLLIALIIQKKESISVILGDLLYCVVRDNFTILYRKNL